MDTEKRVDLKLKGEMLKGIVRGYSDSQFFGEEIKLNDEELKVVESARTTGIGILPNLLSEEELHRVRSAFDEAYRITGMDITKPGFKNAVSGTFLLRFPAIAQLFVHPRIWRIVSDIMNAGPWLAGYGSNFCTPPHPGMKPHDDGFYGWLRSPFDALLTATFLDDISVESGAFTYAPGTHLFYYQGKETDTQKLENWKKLTPEQKKLSEEEFDKRISAADYVPVELTAGSVLFQLSETWHAVNPIYHLRRRVTSFYVKSSNDSLEN